MARNPYGVAHEVLAPAENALSGGIFRHFEPLVRSHDVGLPDGPQITLPRGMPLDVKELENEFDVTVDIPAVSKDDIQISVEHQMLTIKVDKKVKKTEEKKEEVTKWHRWERSALTFQRKSVRLPATADLDNVHAKYENGVLELRVPKKEVKDAGKRIAIQ